MANLSALMLARDLKLLLEERSKAVAYTSSQTHSSLAKGLGILGFHPSQIRKVTCDDSMRIGTALLRSAIEQDKALGKTPFLIVGKAGTTNTSTVDLFIELAAIAREQNLWLHADGAYGASALLCQSRRAILCGIELCDCLSWDAHKWLFQTYGCGMVLVRHRQFLTESFGTTAEYTQDAAETGESLPNFWSYGPELTRPARAMKLWFSFQLLGLNTIDIAINRGFELAETAQSSLEGLKDWEILSPAQMGIILFPFHPHVPAANLDEVNMRISQSAIENNLAATLTTRVRGVLVLRIYSIHPNLSDDEMLAIINGLDQLAHLYLSRASKDDII
ncbi:hypothetical protein M441DRAFT_52489 [Trichoderma asperellum CBS 433.97]|uniref:Uncharacterized protein n=1 Tax=Trichoderma asperellum (strain ATCC 204424 / CBS 433.97 / NBRC 101777) TaxID=1042311 RepID=A0A2T3YR95_TRIA4|nr:hypothetical protein M441DRAFT_52489 [Trichoderma asperellum CBS 433.97]PTB35047.1 hypothetical protein M441DRAFT_52489 [Trichoderma asperellum CBS 433.97]